MSVRHVTDAEVSVQWAVPVLPRRGDCLLVSARAGRAGLRLAALLRPDLVGLGSDLPNTAEETLLRRPPTGAVWVVS